MEGARGLFVGRASFFRGSESAKMTTGIIDHNSSPPFSAGGRFNAARKITPSRQLPVPYSLNSGREAKIAPAIVEAVSVFVVDVGRRIFSSHHLPDNAMRRARTSVNKDLDVFCAARPGRCTDKCSPHPPSRLPYQLAGFRRVIETITEVFGRRQWSGIGRVVFGHRAASNGSRVKWRGGVCAPPRCAS